MPISEDDWLRTPASVQAVVVALWQQVEGLQAQEVALRAAVARLREQVGRNSQSSSQPPSSDAPCAPARPKQPPSGHSAGGPKGHAGHGRALKPVEDVQHVVNLKFMLNPYPDQRIARCPLCENEISVLRSGERPPDQATVAFGSVKTGWSGVTSRVIGA